jgi:hypothetical protein
LDHYWPWETETVEQEIVDKRWLLYLESTSKSSEKLRELKREKCDNNNNSTGHYNHRGRTRGKVFSLDFSKILQLQHEIKKIH